jgi:hypothetical protein
VSIEFPLSRKLSHFGPLVDPRILIEDRTIRGFRGYSFLIDTGADISIVPRRLIPEFGFDWNKLPDASIIGIGRGTVPAKLGQMLIRVGTVELSVRCMFMDQRITPFILGRADFLDRFAVTIDAGQNKIILDELH